MPDLILYTVFLLVLGERATCLFQYDSHDEQTVTDDLLFFVNLAADTDFLFHGNIYSQINVYGNGFMSFSPASIGGAPEDYSLTKSWIAAYGFNIGGSQQPSGSLFLSNLIVPSTTQEDAVNARIVRNYDSTSKFIPSVMFISTWVNVHEEGETNRTPESGSTFQATIATDGTETWVIFEYERLNYEPAVIGVSAGDGANNWKVCRDSSAAIADQVVTKDQLQCSGGYRTIVFPVHSTAWNEGPQCIKYETSECRHNAVNRWQPTGLGLTDALAS